MDLIDEFKITRMEGDQCTVVDDQVVKEFPLTLLVNGRELVTLACSPAYLDELALGYLYSEGLIETAANLLTMRLEDDRVVVQLTGALKEFPPMAQTIITSGCGRSTIHTDLSGSNLQKVTSAIRFSHELIYNLTNNLNRSSALFQETGGVHNALLADNEGSVEIFREDVGRHNAVDKLIGYMLAHELTPDDKIFLTTGRISTEILLKTARRAVPVLVSRSAPTDMAIRLAYRLGITLIGFARGKRMNIYTHPERII